MKTFLTFFILLLILTSCKENKIKKSEHEKTFNDYSQLLDYASTKDSQKFNSKIKEMNLEENFHLQKFNKLYSEQKAIEECNQLLLKNDFLRAKELINQQIKQHGISPLLQDAKDTIYSLEKFHEFKKELPKLNPKVALRRLNQIKTELTPIFAKTANNHKLNAWFNTEFQKIARLNYLKTSQVIDINLMQIDQANLNLDLSTKSGAELFFLGSSSNKKQKLLADRLINLNQNTSQNILCLTDMIMQTYISTKKLSLSRILENIKDTSRISPVAKQLKHRIITKALKDKNIKLDTLEKSTFLNISSFMDISIKSTE